MNLVRPRVRRQRSHNNRSLPSHLSFASEPLEPRGGRGSECFPASFFRGTQFSSTRIILYLRRRREDEEEAVFVITIVVAAFSTTAPMSAFQRPLDDDVDLSMRIYIRDDSDPRLSAPGEPPIRGIGCASEAENDTWAKSNVVPSLSCEKREQRAAGSRTVSRSLAQSACHAVRRPMTR